MSHTPPPGGGGRRRPSDPQRPIVVQSKPTTPNNTTKQIEVELPFFFSEENNRDRSVTSPGGGPFLVRGRVISNRTDNDVTLPGNPTFQSEISEVRVTVAGVSHPPIGVPPGADCKVEILFEHP
jgi:hypothetical protein